MLNALLKEQVRSIIGDDDQLPDQWEAFLKTVSDTYDCHDNEFNCKKAAAVNNTEQINQLNIQLQNEAAELRKAHDEFGRILNSVNHGFFSRDMTTDRYTYLSLGCERIYGYGVEEFFENSRLWFDVIHPGDTNVIREDSERLKNREDVYTQYRIIHKDKSVRWIESTIIPYFKDNRLSRIDGVVNDITKRKEAEAEREGMINELIRSNADLKQFSYITSHNLRSPLSNIKGILNLFQFCESDFSNRKMLEMLKASTEQLNTTIEDLTRILIIKNNVSADSMHLDLAESFNEALTTFTNAINEIEGEVFTDFKAPRVRLNKIYLESIFINLISNAIKFRSPKRPLIIRIESYEDANGAVRVIFSDNGIGIDLHRHKEKVFGLYQRFHDEVEGSGLGLFIVKSQIEAKGGKIAIESEPDKGTRFLLTLRRQISSRIC